MRLIDADALIKKCGGWYVERWPGTGFIGTVKMMVDEMPTINPKPQWTPASDGMPSEHDTYIVTIKEYHGEPTTAFGYYWGDCFDLGGWEVKPEEISAWMTYPEPYKGE